MPLHLILVAQVLNRVYKEGIQLSNTLAMDQLFEQCFGGFTSWPWPLGVLGPRLCPPCL